MTTNICLRCGSPKLVKSHIIPKSAAIKVKGNSSNLITLSHNTKKPTQAGVFVNDILCADCDNQLGKLEKAGLKFCDEVQTKRIGERRLDFKFHSEDARIIERFAYAIVWKAAVSQNYTEARLPNSHANLISKYIFDDKLCFSPLVLVSYYFSNEEIDKAFHGFIEPPNIGRNKNGIFSHFFTIFGVHFFVKTSINRKLTLDRNSIGRSPSVHIFSIKWEDSFSFKSVLQAQVLKEHFKNKTR